MTKPCRSCTRDLPDAAFPPGRGTCRDCLNAHQRATRPSRARDPAAPRSPRAPRAAAPRQAPAAPKLETCWSCGGEAVLGRYRTRETCTRWLTGK